MRTRTISQLESQFDRITRAYGYDNDRREDARQIYCRYKYYITHTEAYKKWDREMKSMLCKDGRVMKRFASAYKEIKALRDNYSVPYCVYGRIEYEWYVYCLYEHMAFKDESKAIEYRNSLMAKYLDLPIEMYKVVKGTQ